ncbi:hypothetical protein QBC37DRAFT_96378 [Rhypophila decipiens]|uniref:Heterokaryon incompatibility domain-containing protein n=1 Tax=Rhypophila decipiens TaxID=261697 RepID=A0AAN6XXH2_9PEZI|nr:hypothetical protein QBC37DRAFT_96378 [Rhypophila decipiens]
MDIFLTPETPIRPVPHAECFPDPDDTNDPFSRWDGGPFLSYAHRKNILHMIPLGLRHGNHRENSTVAFTELINPTDLDQQHKIFTTWFFFGLLAEFLGSNRQEDPDRAPDEADWETNQRQIYEYFVTSVWPPVFPPPDAESAAATESKKKDTNNETKRYLTAQLVPQLLVPNITPTINNLPSTEARQKRINYLGRCLQMTAHYVANTLSKSFSPPALTAICGLAELFSVYLMVNISVYKTFGPDIVPPPTGVGFDFKGRYLSPGSSPREQMTQHGGWCKSDLGRINSVYQRLATAHYISLLDRHVTGRRGEHGACEETICLTAQIDNKTYKLSHADEAAGCECAEFDLDMEAVRNVLLGSESWPILVFEEVAGADGAEVEVRLGVKEFVKGVDEYVALSHVWADGLGNTRGNSLQKCQIARLQRLISGVEKAVHVANPSQPRPKYHLWIDTLCCPVASLNPDTNGISLMRMKSVYECAAHVLVLDLALSVHEVGPLTAVEALLRVFASSIWMRRLWTLQEGVLAQSLFFQFKDQPVHAKSLMNMVANAKDFRYQVLWVDISNEWNRLNDVDLVAADARDRYRHKMYRWIRGALDFRAVTYASDEAICIATLFGMDIRRIIKASQGEKDDTVMAEKRMCELWSMMAERDEGGIPERIVFIVDDPLTTEGFQWAPRSLLTSADKGGNSSYRTLGFASKEWTDEANQKTERGGYLTPYGLAADLPALVIAAKPLAGGMGLHDWDGVLGPHEEDMVYFYHQEAETWYRIMDWHTAQGTPSGTTVRALKDYDGMVAARPLCSSLDSGRIALIKSETDDPYNAMMWLMVQILDDGPVQPPAGSCVSDKPGWRARWLHKVIVAQVHQPEVMVLETMRKVSREVAENEQESTREFIHAKELGTTENGAYRAARESLRRKLKDTMARAWREEPGFAEAVETTYGQGLEEYIWASAPKFFSHERLAKATAVNHRWFID